MDKGTLSKQLAEARRDFSRGVDGVVWEANIGRKISSAVKARPASWIGGAAVIGLVLSQILRRKKHPKIKVESTAKEMAKKQAWYIVLPMALLRMVFPLIKPMLLDYAARMIPRGRRSRERR